MTAAQSDSAAARAFVLKLGHGLQSYGYPSHRLEEAVSLISERLGLEAQFFSMPTTLAFALTSAAASRFFGAGIRELAVAAVIGLATGLLALLPPRLPAIGRVFDPLAAITAAFLATAAGRFFGPVSIYVATLAGLIVLLPGFPLTVALTEIATRHLVSGTARLMGAFGSFLALAVGVALGSTLAERAFGEAVNVAPRTLPEWTLLAALLIAPLGLTVLLRAQPRDAAWIVLSGALGYFGARYGATLLGPRLGAFLGAMAVSGFGNGYVRLTGRPSFVTIVPGLLLLVPGSVGFESLSLLMEDRTLGGIETAFRMLVVGISLAVGLLFGNVLVPPVRLRP